MMNFIKKIWQNIVDEQVHKKFVRYGVGVYRNKALLGCFLRRNNVVVYGSFEFVNDAFVIAVRMAKRATASGTVFFSANFSLQELKKLFSDVGWSETNEPKRKGMLLQLQIEKQQIDAKSAEKLAEKAYALLLDVVSEKVALRTKKKLPKIIVGWKKAAETDEKFWKITADASMWPFLQQEFFFDLPTYAKTVRKLCVSHTIHIHKLVLPKTAKTPEDMRKMAKREGVIERKIAWNGNELVSKKKFLA